MKTKITFLILLISLISLPLLAAEYKSISGTVASVTVNPMDGRYYNSMTINLVGFGPIQPLCYGTIQWHCQHLHPGDNVTLLTQIVRTAPAQPPFIYIVKTITKGGVTFYPHEWNPTLTAGSRPIFYSYELIMASGLNRMLINVCHFKRSAQLPQAPQPWCAENLIAISMTQWCQYLRAIPIPTAVFTPPDLDAPGQAEAEAARVAAVSDCP